MPGQYDEYRRAMNWRPQLQENIPSGSLLSAIGLNGPGPAKLILVDYFPQTQAKPRRRTSECSTQWIDSWFMRESEDLLMPKLTFRNYSNRRKSGDMRSFRMRSERLQTTDGKQWD